MPVHAPHAEPTRIYSRFRHTEECTGRASDPDILTNGTYLPRAAPVVRAMVSQEDPNHLTLTCRYCISATLLALSPSSTPHLSSSNRLTRVRSTDAPLSPAPPPAVILSNLACRLRTSASTDCHVSRAWFLSCSAV